MNPQSLSNRVTFSSDLGWIGLTISSDEWNRPQVDHLTFGHASELLASEALDLRPQTGTHSKLDFDPNPSLRDWIDRLQHFAAGRSVDLSDLRINLGYLTDFGCRVIDACRDVPWGETASYGELARRAGSPGASRAVGGVMARNRHPLVVPCHRIIASNGAQVGFSAPDGTKMKQRLLQNEKKHVS
ncbi:MAG: methylated-DNA--[protein]-cysteine S-methyltransferase [Pirellulaceae bacterium]|nr:methylated-DNA--[protein]-cysteine S-methyltransferase [Pirellulaceae bacterium]